MTQEEIRVNSTKKELEKIEASLAKKNTLLEKKNATCTKLGCAWTQAEMRAKADAKEISDKQWNAWFSREVLKSEIEDKEERKANIEKRLAKETGKYEEKKAEIEKTEIAANIEKAWVSASERNPEAEKEEYERWLAEFKAECLKDGVKIEEVSNYRVSGTTKDGRKFSIDNNNGFAMRSRYCYSLWIEGTTVFTSGLFETAYAIIAR